MTCSKRRIVNKTYCVGDLRHIATIQNRVITAVDDSVDYEMVFSGSIPDNEPDAQTWVGVKTVRGVTVFDQTNVERTISHEIVMRYRDDVTAQNWLLIDGYRYDIYQVENVNELNTWLVLQCNKRGTEDNSVNAA